MILKDIVQKNQTRKGVEVEANMLSLQFCGKAALKRRITNTERAKRARENTFFAFFHQKILIVGLIVKFYKPFSQ